MVGLVPSIARTNTYMNECRKGYVKGTMPIKGNANHINSMYAGNIWMLPEFLTLPFFMSTFGMDIYSRFAP